MDASLAPKIQPARFFSTIPSEFELTVGVVGLGRWGRNLLRTFEKTPRVAIRALADSRSEVAHQAAAEVSLSNAVTSVEALFARCSAVVVATPPASHAELATAALGAGCHVFVEKPMALSSLAADGMVATASRAERVLMVGHILRYHEGFARARSLCEAGELGELVEIHCERLSPSGVQRPEGAWWTLAPHDVDLVRWLCGGSPITIEAKGSTLTHARIDFGHGVAHIRVGHLPGERRRRLAVFGTRGSILVDDTGASYRLDRYDAVSLGTLKGGIDPALASTRLRGREIATLEQDPLTVEAAHFVAAVLDRVAIRSNAVDGYECVRLLAAGAASIASNGAPVAL